MSTTISGTKKLTRNSPKLHECPTDEPMHIEQIIVGTDLAPGSINASLVSLRLKGLIKQLPGNLFLRN